MTADKHYRPAIGNEMTERPVLFPIRDDVIHECYDEIAHPNWANFHATNCHGCSFYIICISVFQMNESYANIHKILDLDAFGRKKEQVE